ncbi:MAG: hypothetical protein R3C03_01630 [Pirellulaceae bacterium]
MLAKTTPKWLATLMFASGLLITGSVSGQQQPSKTQRLCPQMFTFLPVAQRLPERETTQFNLSDQSRVQPGNMRLPKPEELANQIRQTSYTQEEQNLKQQNNLLGGNRPLLPPSDSLNLTQQRANAENAKNAPAAAPVQNQGAQLQKPAALPTQSNSPTVATGAEFQQHMSPNRLGNMEATQLPAIAEPEASSRISTTMTQTNGSIASTSYGQQQEAVKAKENAIISTTTPAVDIQAYGPPTIGIHKKAQYKVVVRNTTKTDAEHLTVTIQLPQWVQMENVSTTIGRREGANEQRNQRINWIIDRLAAGSSQIMTIDTIPSKAEHFDLVVDWTMQTRSNSTKIAVTEPRLDMTIAGPNEVMYGETAMYEVTVRNPGTGTAENVSVMLPEALGGERASLGEIAPGQERKFQVELLARAAGQLDLTTIATGSGDLQTAANQMIVVRRPALDVALSGPPLKYSGSVAQFEVTVTNSGDAIARDVTAGFTLPAGVKYLGGIEGAEVIDNLMRWTIGTLDVGDKRTYQIQCQLNGEGQMQFELGTRGSSDTAGIAQCVTKVETVADLVLSVEDPKGPLPTGQKIDYVIRIRNRGSRSATNLNLVMQYSEGVEPTTATGLTHQVVPGQVIFTPIASIDPGEELTVQVTAHALNAGSHRFRAQLTSTDSDAHEVAEGTTRFYGDSITPTVTAQGSGDSSFQRK